MIRALVALAALASVYTMAAAEPFTIDETGRPVVAATVNGQAVRLVLDTGATRSALTQAAADRLRLERTGARVSGVGGSARAERASLEEIAFADSGRRNAEAFVIGDDLTPGADGLLGVDAFAGRRLVLDFGAGSAGIEAGEATNTGGTTFAAYGRLLRLRVSVNGVEAVALLDTGTTHTLVNPALVRAAGLETREGGGEIVGAGAAQREQFTAIREIDLGGLYLGGLPALVADISAREGIGGQTPTVILGAGVLRAFSRVMFDYGRSEIHLIAPSM